MPVWGEGRGGNRGRGRKKNSAMGPGSALESFTTLAGSKCNSLKRLSLGFFCLLVCFYLYNFTKKDWSFCYFLKFLEFLSHLLFFLFGSVQFETV